MKMGRPGSWILVIGMALAVIAASADAAWAFKGLAIITAGGVVIKGDNTTKELPGGIVVRSISFGASIGALGRPQFERFGLIKEPDQATPLLLKALALGSPMTVEIRWFRQSPTTGAEELYFTVKLGDAQLIDMRAGGDVTVAGGVNEFLSFAFGEIAIRDVIHNVEFVTTHEK